MSPKAWRPDVEVAVDPNGGGTARMREVMTGSTVATWDDCRRVLTVASVIAFGPAARRSSVYIWSESAFDADTLIAVAGPPLVNLLTIRLPALVATLARATSSAPPRGTARMVSSARPGRRRRRREARVRESSQVIAEAVRHPTGSAARRAARPPRCA